MSESLAEWFAGHVAIDKGFFKPEAQAKLEQVARILTAWESAPAAIMDTRDALGICAPAEDEFPALRALQGKRVRLVVDPIAHVAESIR